MPDPPPDLDQLRRQVGHLEARRARLLEHLDETRFALDVVRGDEAVPTSVRPSPRPDPYLERAYPWPPWLALSALALGIVTFATPAPLLSPALLLTVFMSFVAGLQLALHPSLFEVSPEGLLIRSGFEQPRRFPWEAVEAIEFEEEMGVAVVVDGDELSFPKLIVSEEGRTLAARWVEYARALRAGEVAAAHPYGEEKEEAPSVPLRIEEPFVGGATAPQDEAAGLEAERAELEMEGEAELEAERAELETEPRERQTV
ncbi:MAG: PH domain-containing protein [Myxococcota bacterium]